MRLAIFQGIMNTQSTHTVMPEEGFDRANRETHTSYGTIKEWNEAYNVEDEEDNGRTRNCQDDRAIMNLTFNESGGSKSLNRRGCQVRVDYERIK